MSLPAHRQRCVLSMHHRTGKPLLLALSILCGSYAPTTTEQKFKGSRKGDVRTGAARLIHAACGTACLSGCRGGETEFTESRSAGAARGQRNVVQFST